MRSTRRLYIILAIALLVYAIPAFAAPEIVIRNNHDFTYTGPVAFKTNLPTGDYAGSAGVGKVRNGIARVAVTAPAHSSVSLDIHGKPGAAAITLNKNWSVTMQPGGMDVILDKQTTAKIEFGLAVIPGKDAVSTQAVDSFKLLDIQFVPSPDGGFIGNCTQGDYQVQIKLVPYGGVLDVEASITRTKDSSDPEYLALVRRVTTTDITGIRTDWNGIIIKGTENPTVTDRIATLAKGVGWVSWKTSGMSWAVINQFSAGYTTQDSKGKWIPANHFYTWEKAAQKDDSLYLISEIAGPNPTQDKGKYMGVRSYCPPLKNEPVVLKWRLATTTKPSADWEKSQLYVTAGYRNVTETAGKAVVDLGVPYVEFGTSYFPYSTMTENFDYYRTAGLDREGWWPFSPKLWEDWPKLKPQMATDLRIIKAMGFDLVRLHHLELLGAMDRQNCYAFLDFYMDQCRKLGLKVLFDTAGSDEWVCSVVSRYKDVVKYVEIENEILIPGIPKGSPERWTGQYKAVKKASPSIQSFLTGACNQGMFDRLKYLGVPFDRIGFHNYKHGAAYKESIPSVMLGVANQATDYGTSAVLGEFNWKLLTAMAPEARANEVAQIYAKALEPRAIPTFLQFHWQETMSVNPRLTRQGIRHYETINLDRTPKPEALELMKLIKQYARQDSPVRALPIEVETVPMVLSPKTVVRFTVTNNGSKPVAVKLSTECFDKAGCKLLSPATANLKPHAKYTGELSPSFSADALPGVYHFFVRAEYAGGTSYGWGIMRNVGVPKFDAPVLADLVEYPQGADVVDKVEYMQPVCVAFGKDCPIIEMEMAYQVRNTLQAATGHYVHLCSTADIPEAMKDCTLILVGTPQSNKLIGATNPDLSDKGRVILQDVGGGAQWLYLTGKTSDQVQAAATDFVLRFWNNAKDSVSRVSGLDKGAALGNKAAAGDVNLP